MPWLAEDRQRLNSFRQGDQGTLTEVYRVYAPLLARRLASRMRMPISGSEVMFVGAGSPFDLQDILQETFIRVFSQGVRLAYDGLRPFAPYLEGVAKNLLADWYRQSGRRVHLFAEHLSETSERQDPSPELQAISAQTRELYDRFVASLCERDRQLIRLRVESGESRRVVAEKTGYSAMTVRTREQKLRSALHRLLREASPEPIQ